MFNISGRRLWYGDEEMSQAEVAKLAGVPCSFVEQAERSRRLPNTIVKMLRVALALHVPIEKLIAPQIVDRVVDEIEARRRAWVTEKKGP